MSFPARIYCSVVIGIGVAFAVGGASTFVGADTVRLVAWLLMAMILAPLKLRIPGLTATVSGAAAIIFGSIASLTFGETVLIAGVAAVVQCYIGALEWPRPIQSGFSAAAMAISVGSAYITWHGLTSPAIQLIGAAAVYFLLNTALVAGILSLTEPKPFGQVWIRLYLWTFPYYLVSACLGGLLQSITAKVNDGTILLLLPVICLLFAWGLLVGQRLAARTPAR